MPRDGRRHMEFFSDIDTLQFALKMAVSLGRVLHGLIHLVCARSKRRRRCCVWQTRAMRARPVLWMITMLSLLGAGTALASEDWPSAKEADAAGREAFAAGDYERAVRAFSRAYALDPDPRLAANLAEAHRRLGHCEAALEHFEIYLAAAAAGPARARIEARATELRAECPPPVAEPSPSPGSTPRMTPPAAPPPAPASAEPQAVKTPAPPPPSPTRWRLALDAGASFGRWSAARSTSPAVRLAAGPTWRWGNLELGAGLGVQWSTFGYASRADAPAPYEERAQALEAIAEVQGRWHLAAWLAGRLEIGAGVAWYSGFEPWNEIADSGAAAEGGATLAVRSALGADLPLGAGFEFRLNPIGVSWHRNKTSSAANALNFTVSAGLARAF